MPCIPTLHTLTHVRAHLCPHAFLSCLLAVAAPPGISNAVGLALAQANLAAKFNEDGFTVSDNFTYVICGDGCLQEGVSSEACSLAGHLGLGKLIVLYDDNKITIDGTPLRLVAVWCPVKCNDLHSNRKRSGTRACCRVNCLVLSLSVFVLRSCDTCACLCVVLLFVVWTRPASCHTGSTDLSFTEDVLARYEAYGWHTLTVEGGDSDTTAIAEAVAAARAVTDKPSLIKIRCGTLVCCAAASLVLLCVCAVLCCAVVVFVLVSCLCFRFLTRCCCVLFAAAPSSASDRRSKAPTRCMVPLWATKTSLP